MATHEIEWIYEVGNEDIQLNIGLSIEPFLKGRIYGPPENCYPDEGGYATVEYINRVIADSEGRREEDWRDKLPESEIVKIEAYGYEDYYNFQECLIAESYESDRYEDFEKDF